jgi:mono/diheme cytochrome c family protein
MKTRQLITVFTITALSLAVAATIAGANRQARKEAAVKAAASERIRRGEYLVTIGGCNDCHTPWKMGPNGPEPDMSRMLSGHPENLPMPPAPAVKGPWGMTAAATNTAWAGPWGVSFTRNLTPDPLTGIGIWDEAMFIRTLRSGRHWGTSRPILPPMPWFNYAKMTDEDLKAVYAYLRTIPPVKNQVPDAILAPQ